VSRAKHPPAGDDPLASRIGPPPKLVFPDGWTLSGAWQRAQTADAHLGPVDAAHFDVLLSRENGEWGGKHRVLFAIQNGALRAECDCKAWTHRDWCAHVATLWWRWTREQLGVTDLDADRVHLSPPWWLSIEDENGGALA
jgi:hypothetical protein